MLIGKNKHFELEDYILIPVSFAIIVLYHCYFYYCLLRKPAKISFTVNLFERTRWVKRMMLDNLNGAEILGVQTLRNMSMGTSFLASAIIVTAASLMGVLLNQSPNSSLHISNPVDRAISSSSSSSTTASSSSSSADETTLYWELRLGLLVACLFMAFLCFAQSIRCSTHASFLISLRPPTAEEMEEEDALVEEDRALSMGPSFLDPVVTHPIHRTRSHMDVVKSTVTLIGKSTVSFFIGIRLMFLVIPLAAWLIDSYALLIGTFIKVGILLITDFY